MEKAVSVLEKDRLRKEYGETVVSRIAELRKKKREAETAAERSVADGDRESYFEHMSTVARLEREVAAVVSEGDRYLFTPQEVIDEWDGVLDQERETLQQFAKDIFEAWEKYKAAVYAADDRLKDVYKKRGEYTRLLGFPAGELKLKGVPALSGDVKRSVPARLRLGVYGLENNRDSITGPEKVIAGDWLWK